MSKFTSAVTDLIAVAIEKESTFSADWWCNDIVFRLEQRAIFSKVSSRHSISMIRADNAIELDVRYTS